jgi:hypothetical protein
MTYNPNGEDTHEYDPFDDAMTDEPSRFFGQVTIEAYQVIFEKDAGGKWGKPEQYVPELHGDEAEIAKDDGKFLSTQIDFNFTPVDPTRKIWIRTMGAKNRKRPEFQRVVRPSIEALSDQIAQAKGLQVGQFNPLREISGMWVGGEFVPRPSNKEGETWTTLKFTSVYADQAACKQAADEAYNREVDEVPAEQSAEDANKAALIPFLYPLWEQAKKQAEENDTFNAADIMAGLLKVNPLLAETFTVDSYEVQTIINADAEDENEEPREASDD